ncbi:hypothetical protein [Bacillus taeanensis]|uniref:Uncharacterized protein n=1 Tax=Bacillus taeanensis TaxID=273032 RepID=A0A366XWD2_9BACI|nr:hypothetical protein [Bacillus taeanensis]RBW69465.1 hypothetical protein DS031_11110 [Bacillus taeanensis]
MEIDKLKEGQVFKNYKELCKELGVEIKNGKSKKYQLVELSRYCNYRKDGHKFNIEEVYKNPLPKVENKRNAKYKNLIELLVLDLLAQCNDKSITISRSKLLRIINMTNIYYGYCSENVPELSDYTKIREAIIYDFYNTSNSNFKSTVETALKGLRDRSVIIYNTVTKVSKDNKTVNETATEEELEIILECENKVLEELGFEKISEVRCSRYWKKFKKSVKEKLNERSNIDFYYIAYDITISKKYIDKKLNNLADLVLEDAKREEYKSELNADVCTNLLKNAQKRHGANKDNKMKIHREKNDYVAKIDKLINLLVNDENNKRVNLKDVKLEASPFEDVEDKFLTETLDNDVFRGISF